MLLTPLLHPQTLSALGCSAHGSRLLIADGNYPYGTQVTRAAQRVFLNLRPGLVRVSEVLEVLVATIPIEAAMVRVRPNGTSVPLHQKFPKSCRRVWG